MQINPYLAFNGQCRAAFKYYEHVLGGKLAMMMTYGESPEPDKNPAVQADAIMHARLEVGDAVVMGGDAPPQYHQKPQGFCVSIQVDNAADGARIFNALADKGQVNMPFGETFWAERFGMCVDQFGIPWMVNFPGAKA